jgi:hypothetical protein
MDCRAVLAMTESVLVVANTRHCEPKGRGNPFLTLRSWNRLLRCTLSVLLAMTITFQPCHAAIEFGGVDLLTIPTITLTSDFTISLWTKYEGSTVTVRSTH